MERVAIVGNSGSGKSTLARELGAITGLPVVHLDVEYWRPGWVRTPDDEWEPRVRELVAHPRWISEGNFGGTMDLRFARADTVVFLDLSAKECVWRVIDRALAWRGARRPDLAPGCDEQLDPEFLAWVYGYNEHERPLVQERLRTLGPQTQVVWLRSAKAIERWLQGLPKQ